MRARRIAIHILPACPFVRPRTGLLHFPILSCSTLGGKVRCSHFQCQMLLLCLLVRPLRVHQKRLQSQDRPQCVAHSGNRRLVRRERSSPADAAHSSSYQHGIRIPDMLCVATRHGRSDQQQLTNMGFQPQSIEAYHQLYKTALSHFPNAFITLTAVPVATRLAFGLRFLLFDQERLSPTARCSSAAPPGGQFAVAASGCKRRSCSCSD